MYDTGYAPLGGDHAMKTILQLQKGRVDLSKSGNVMLHSVDAKSGKVSKSATSTQFEPAGVSDVVVMQMDFMIPKGNPVNSIFLADFESASSGLSTNPGVRVQLRDGVFQVDRSKIGADHYWYSTQKKPIQTDTWYDLRVEMKPGAGDSGAIKLYLNDTLILSQTGSTILTPDVVKGSGVTVSKGLIDRVQVGLTANSNKTDAAVAVRDVEITVQRGKTLEQHGIDPREAVHLAASIYRDGTESDPVTLQQNPDRSYFGERLVGGAGADTLIGTSFDDVLIGRRGNDVLRGGQGDDILKGGQGRDVFVFDLDGSRDVVVDFQPGTDRIAINDPSGRFSDYDVTATRDGALLHDGTNSILLADVSVSALGADDFFFF